MRTAILPLLALAACADTGVMQIGPGRYRVTQESFWSAGTAETAVAQRASEYCATSGRLANVNITSRPPVLYSSYAGASADFTCVTPSEATR